VPQTPKRHPLVSQMFLHNRCPLWAYSVEKLQNRDVQYFRYRSKIPKTAAKLARPDSQVLQGCDTGKISYPFGKNLQNTLYEAAIFGPEANGEFFNMG